MERSRAVLVGTLGLVFIAACEEPRQVPYIAPVLENWPETYEGHPGLVLHAFEVGKVSTPVNPLLAGGGREKEEPVWAYVVKHHEQGLVVIDTGLDPKAGAQASGGIGGLLGAPVTAKLEEGQDLPSQMKANGLDPDAVRWVLLTDLRFFHAGRAEAFEHARVVVGRSELEAARSGGLGYEQRLFDDIESWKILDWETTQPLGTMRAAVDLFDDGSCMALDVRGATPGTVAFLLRMPSRPVFLAAALAPTRATARYAAKPSTLDDADAWWDHIWRLKRFKDLVPSLLIVPGSDATVLRGEQDIVWHEFAARTPRAEPTATANAPRLPGAR